MSLYLDASTDCVLAMRERDGVLPYVRIGVLPVERFACGAYSKEAIDSETRSFRQVSRRRHTNIGRIDWLRNDGKAIEAHIAEARDVDEARPEDVSIGQDKHVVVVEFVGAP